MATAGQDSTQIFVAETEQQKKGGKSEGMKKLDASNIPSQAESNRIIKEFEVKIQYLKSIREKKREQVKADLEEMRFIESEIETTKPKVEALALVIDLKERKKKMMEEMIHKQSNDLENVALTTADLVKNLRTTGRRLERKMANDTSTEAKGYSTSISVADIRKGKTREDASKGRSNEPKKAISSGNFAVV